MNTRGNKARFAIFEITFAKNGPVITAPGDTDHLEVDEIPVEEATEAKGLSIPQLRAGRGQCFLHKDGFRTVGQGQTVKIVP